MTDFRKLAETLADRLWDANSTLAYLSEKNFIDDGEAIMKTWEILADARNLIQEPEPELEKELARLKRYDVELSKVMNPDFKDWFQNSKEEYPEIAAWVISNLREHLDLAYQEIDRLSGEPQ